MRKINLVLIMFFIIILSGCKLFGMTDIIIALRNTDKLDSYKMDMTFELDGEQALTSYSYVVGNYQELHINDETIKMFDIDGTIYNLVEWYGLPILEDGNLDEEEYDDFNLFESYDFVEDGDYYVLEGESDLFEGISTIKFKVEDKKIKEMILIGETEISGTTSYMTIIVEYSKYNEVDIEIPLYLTEEEIEMMEGYFETQIFFDILNSYDGFFIMGNPGMDCFDPDFPCFIESEPPLDYNLETQEVSYMDQNNWVPYETFVNSISSETITLEYFEFINYYAELHEKYN